VVSKSKAEGESVMAIYNKEKFLDNIARKLGSGRLKGKVERPVWKYQPQWNLYKGYSQDQLVEMLREQCRLIHTDFLLVTSQSLPDVLLETMRAYGVRRAIAWDDPRFREYALGEGFIKRVKEEGIDLRKWDVKKGEENISFAEKADVGITFSDMTLAESGTVVLFSDSGKGRSVSLLPFSYLVIIPKSTIVPRMTQAVREIHERVERGEQVPSCISFISGPSNTADIEMNLVVGVHGPVRVAYIVVEDR
jgi:L-lactate dehydrogenase complex protein LldG